MLQGEGSCSPGLWERRAVRRKAENPGSSHMDGGDPGRRWHSYNDAEGTNMCAHEVPPVGTHFLPCRASWASSPNICPWGRFLSARILSTDWASSICRFTISHRADSRNRPGQLGAGWLGVHCEASCLLTQGWERPTSGGQGWGRPGRGAVENLG